MCEMIGLPSPQPKSFNSRVPQRNLCLIPTCCWQRESLTQLEPATRLPIGPYFMSNTERRTFIKIITAGAVGSFAGITALGQDGRSPVIPESFLLDANDWVPNSPVL